MTASAQIPRREKRIAAALPSAPPSKRPWLPLLDRPRDADDLGIYAYVKADPINFTDPSGLDQLGLFCDGGSSCADIEITGGGGGSSEHGNYHGTQLGGGAGGRFLPRLFSEGAGGGLAGRLGDALDKFAEEHLKPPEDRKKDESRQQCFSRVAGLSHALAVVGGSNIAAGIAGLGYKRVGIAGGGGGTSLISSAARGAIGKVHMGLGILGTGDLGGAIGRGLSKASVATGAAALGWAAGTIAGAIKKCQ